MRSVILLALMLPARAAFSPSCSTVDSGTLRVSFDVSTLPAPADLFYVQLAPPALPDKPFALVTTLEFPVNVTGLSPSQSYLVSVRAHNASTPSIVWGPSWSMTSETIECSTSDVAHQEYNGSAKLLSAATNLANSKFLQVYRISEYSFDVDFLANHDGASVDAMPLYLMTGKNMWSVENLTDRWDSCQESLYEICPGLRGAAFDCVDCATANRDAVTAACGNWSAQDTLDGEGSFSVHWHCGVGWPESTAKEGPITEYCVEYLPLDNIEDEESSLALGDDATNNADGFATYLSCNSDEVDAFGNDARDPSCICICYSDRMLSHQSLAEFQRDCSVLTDDPQLPWVNTTNCNCPHTDSPFPVPGAPNSPLVNIGRSPIFLPYVGVPLTPHGPHPGEQPSGHNFHFPKGGACAEGEALGSGGCTWRRLPASRMIYGDDLEAAGWDLAFVADTPTNMSHTRANQAAFVAALRALDAKVAPVTCGGLL